MIFDTPGSNSNTNMDHEKVLTDSLDGFSNGIPIWVSGYDSIDSIDNAHLCDKLYKIEALDKRFTMIVINKADSVELPGDGLGEDAINNIMEYESVEKMYSSGIYFVSSIMGLGAKNLEGIYNDYLLEVFDEKKRKFSDPSAKSYKKLYEYNIMPEQMKARAIAYSLDCNNLIYANSGLLCVEMEMEQFASKHAAYNKCQMVYAFLKIFDYLIYRLFRCSFINILPYRIHTFFLLLHHTRISYPPNREVLYRLHKISIKNIAATLNQIFSSVDPSILIIAFIGR